MPSEAEINALCEEIDKIGERMPEEIGLVDGLKVILDRLLIIGWLVIEIVQIARIGIHPENRDKYGANFNAIHELLIDIVRIGFSFDKLGVPLLAEDSPNTPGAIEHHNKRLAAGNQLLAPVVPGSVLYGSLSATHTIQGLRCLDASVPCDHPLVSFAGKMDLGVAEKRTPDIGKAIRDGVRCRVIKAAAMQRFPWLAAKSQASEQASGQLQRAENEVQLMCRAHQVAMLMKQLDWEKVKNEVMASMPRVGPPTYVHALAAARRHPPTPFRRCVPRHEMKVAPPRCHAEFGRAGMARSEGGRAFPGVQRHRPGATWCHSGLGRAGRTDMDGRVGLNCTFPPRAGTRRSPAPRAPFGPGGRAGIAGTGGGGGHFQTFSGTARAGRTGRAAGPFPPRIRVGGFGDRPPM